MATQNVSIVTYGDTGTGPPPTGGATLSGVTRVTLRMSRTVTPKHYDDEHFAQCAAIGGWLAEGTIESVDLDEIIGLENSTMYDLQITCPAADGGGSKRVFDVANVLFNQASGGTGEPGDGSTATISFTATADSPTGYAIAIST